MKVFDEKFFKDRLGGVSAEEISFLVRICNEKINEELKNAIEVQGFKEPGDVCLIWSEIFLQADTHKGLLINIQEIKHENPL